MVSSKFAHRRRTRGTPTVCHTRPKPIVPPYYPYPPTWPKTDLWIHVIADWNDGGTPHHVDYIICLWQTTPPWDWKADINGGLNQRFARWTVNTTTHTAILILSGADNGSPFSFQAENIPVNWGSIAHYLITSWHYTYRPADTGSAEFDF